MTVDISSTTLILVGVVCIALGFFASVLLNTLTDDSDVIVEGDEAPPGGKKGRYELVTRLWREKKSDTLVVEIDGKAFQTTEAVQPAQREKLERAARDLRGWLGMAGSNATGSERRVEADREMTAGSIPTMNAPEMDLRRAYAMEPDSPEQPSISSAAPVRPARPITTVEQTSPTGGSIVMQINDILQELRAKSTLAGQDIHLSEDTARGVIVTVGNKIYQGIDSVPEGDVKQLLRAAVQQWERSQ